MLKVLPQSPSFSSPQGGGLGLAQRGGHLIQELSELSGLNRSQSDLWAHHFRRLNAEYGDAGQRTAEAWRKIWEPAPAPADLMQAFTDYLTDFGQRTILFLDIMRQVGNNFVAQMDGDGKLVLVYDYQMAVDGRSLERPVNYALVHILPPAGAQVNPLLRPYVIIDPRAGHGAGIGGFKSDSQVGVALAQGHAVYFVIFFPQPEPGQTLADVCAAEGVFVREVARRHPNAPKPVIVGNCQGGWATMLLAASNPDVTGPVVANGAPLSYWAGVRGKNPLRYTGGLAGGALPAALFSDLGNGRFDGANLVLNFEAMNPGNTWWSKYYNVFAHVDTEAPRFIGFERWWSSYYFMNEAEIRWIIENLFVGNKLQRGEAVLGGRSPVDLKRIKAPIILFASKGDDITPPQQALNWIPAVYSDEREIRARGQRIVYMVHKDIGHLGIFVSAKVALKEHDRIVTILEMVEALAPGLYEMRIEKKVGEGADALYHMACEERTVADLRALDDGQTDEAPFALVARLSRFWVDGYELTARPFVKAMVTPAFAEAMVRLHPLRMRRYILSDRNPAMGPVATLAEQVRADRKPVRPNNPFFHSEKLCADVVEQTMTFLSDVKAAGNELLFFALYANPFLTRLTEGRAPDPTVSFGETLRELPKVEAALVNVERGGFAEAVIRMLILMARSRGAVRQSRLARSNAILQSTEPFQSMGEDVRTQIINEQTLIIDFESDAAIAALRKLLPATAERQRAIKLVEEIAGDPAEMSEPTIRMLLRLRETLGLLPSSLEPAAANPWTDAAGKPAPVEVMED
jgi:pimeloyl-ACP methyl ester carboxylesterase/tellurite resistance protein